MDVEIAVEYTEKLICRTTRRFWLRWLGWRYFVTLVLALALTLCLWISGYHTCCAVLGTATALLLAVGVFGYFIYRKRALATYLRMETPESTFRFGDDEVSIQSELGESRVKWKVFTKVWRFPEVWLLFSGDRSYVTLPTQPLSPDVKQFIITKVEENGGKVW